MPTDNHKVLAYITHGQRPLLLRHPLSPEAGIQLPAGTVRPGEAPEQAVLREAREEAGLADLKLVSFLGEQDYTRLDHRQEEVHNRRYYHLRRSGDHLKRWRHDETDPSDGSVAGTKGRQPAGC